MNKKTKKKVEIFVAFDLSLVAILVYSVCIPGGFVLAAGAGLLFAHTWRL